MYIKNSDLNKCYVLLENKFYVMELHMLSQKKKHIWSLEKKKKRQPGQKMALWEFPVKAEFLFWDWTAPFISCFILPVCLKQGSSLGSFGFYRHRMRKTTIL